MIEGQPRDARDEVGEGGKITRPAVPRGMQVVSSHSAAVQEVGVPHKVPSQEDRSGCTDYPLAQFLPVLIVVAVVVHRGYEGDSEDDVASYALDGAGKRGDAEQAVEVVAQTQRHVMQRLCSAISTGAMVN